MSDLPRDILLFVAAYEERSFTAAAVREGATQSGVSQHIRKLEERFGARLFERDAGRVSPTPAGDRYYRRCLDILRAHAAAAQTLRDFSRGLSGEVAVGLMPTMTRCALAPSLARFVDLHPNVTIHITEEYSGALTDRVRGGELDFAVVPAFPALAGLTSRPFATTPEVLVSAADGGREHGRPVRPCEIGPVKLVLPQRQNTRRHLVESYVGANRMQVERVLELDAMFGTLDLVATTDWVTILPGVMMARELAPGGLVINPLHDPALSLDLVLIAANRRELSPAAHAFEQVLREETVRASTVWSSGPEAVAATEGRA
jgi:DNA-binding transcriptional LysR family regulator